MGISLAAAHFHAVHAVAAVRVFRDNAGHDRFCKAGPSAAGIKFVSRGEKRFSCDDIHIEAWLVMIPILSCKGPFGGGILGHVILLPGQPFLKLCLVRLYACAAVRTYNEVLKTAEINMAVTMGMILQIVLVVILCRIKIPQWF